MCDRKSDSVASVFLCPSLVASIESVKELIGFCVGELGTCVEKFKLHMVVTLVNRNVEFMLII